MKFDRKYGFICNHNECVHRHHFISSESVGMPAGEFYRVPKGKHAGVPLDLVERVRQATPLVGLTFSFPMEILPWAREPGNIIMSLGN